VNPPHHPASLNTLFTIAAKGYGHLYFRRNVSFFNFGLAAQSGTLDWQRRLIRNVRHLSETVICAPLAGLTALRRPHNGLSH